MRKLVIPSVASVLVVAAMLYQAKTVDPFLAEAPEIELSDLSGFESAVLPPSEAEQTVLPKDTRVDKRVYTDEDGVSHHVTVVVGGRSKSSVHRPELCLPSQGFQMTSPRNLDAEGIDWHCVTLARRDAPPMRFAYTFFNQAGFRTSSHLRRIFKDVWDRSVLGRIDRWVMVTVSSSASDDASLVAFLGKLRGVVK